MHHLLNDFADDVKWFGETFTDGIEEIVDIISTSLLISNSILIEILTEDAIREELHDRHELTTKKVSHIVIQDFIAQSGYTEVTLAALNAERQQVGTIKMQTYNYSSVKERQKIKI